MWRARLGPSEISTALFAGIGMNMLSHILVSHLAEAEKRFNE